MFVVVGFFVYATWNGITYWEDKAERNTEYNNNNRVRSGYGQRFYHK
jgi:hypothetical protein